MLKERKVLAGLNKHHGVVKWVNHTPPDCGSLDTTPPMRKSSQNPLNQFL